MFYLADEDVLALYVEQVGTAEALIRPELLASAVASPQATMFGEDLHPHIFSKAAALLRSIAQNQPFSDGNKRIAWLAMRVFLASNGIDVRATTQDGLQLMMRLAAHSISLDDTVCFWRNVVESGPMPTNVPILATRKGGKTAISA